VKDLKKWNNLEGNHLIYPGQVLSLPDTSPTHTVARKVNGKKETGKKSETLGEETPRQKKIYRIKSGDNLAHIAKAHRVTISDICRWNGISRKRTIYPGEELVLMLPVTSTSPPAAPPSEESPPKLPLDNSPSVSRPSSDRGKNPVTPAPTSDTQSMTSASVNNSEKRIVEHTVKRGESIARIAKNYKISSQKIIEWNNLNPDKYIYPGDELILWID
jgi:membrane-bound lytic murein transglycosylase D